jgi:hypothetical protein
MWDAIGGEMSCARLIGGRYQPVGGDFAGSTIETGGELVPGISR